MTQQAQTIQGSIVAIVTPMLKDGGVDWKSLEKLVEWHIEQGTNSIVAVWYNRRSLNIEHGRAHTGY